MKRIFLHFIFSFFIISGVFAQEQFYSASSNNNDPLPLSTTTVTCPPLTLVISGTDPLCNGDANGTVSVVASGGTLPYTYLWTPTSATTATVTGLTANTYLVEVWDNTGLNYCSGSIGIANPASLIVNITPPGPVTSCFGLCDGSATANPSGGTPAYTYSWNTAPVQTTPSVTGLCFGTNTVTITDSHGCVRVKTFGIGQPPLLVANGSNTTINCFGNCNGTASVAPAGGTFPYTYSWSPGGATTSALAGLCSGTFVCTVTDSHTCTATYTAVISQPTLLVVSATSTNVTCNSSCNGTATATASGGIPAYTYSWAPGGATTSAVTGLCANNYTITLTDANGCVKTATVSITQPGAITVSPTGTNITCFSQCNGTVSANASGGTLPYTYSWSPGGCTASSCSGLCFGNYSVTVTDSKGCTQSGTVTLTQPASFTASLSKTDVVCPGLCNGSVTATVTGGTSPYTYAWTPGGCSTSACAGLCSGTYSVTITDAKGCTTTGNVTVNMPSPLLTNITNTNVACFGSCNGTVMSSATGGTPPYTYSWAPGGCSTSACSNLCAGNYTLTLMDANGCPKTGTVAIIQPSTFSVSVSSATPNPLNCNGDCNGTAATTVTGGTPIYTYSWSTGATTPSITGLCKGTYTLQVTDANACTATTSVIFLEPTTLSVTIASSNPSCNGKCNGSISAVAGGGTPGYTFAWLPGNQTTSSIAGLCANNYTITVQDNKGCSNTQTVTLTDPALLAANASVVNNVLCAGQCNGSATAAPSGGTSPFTYLWTGGQTTNTATGLCQGSFSVTVTDANGCTNISTISTTQPGVLSSSIFNTTSSCTLCNGTATVTTTGGTTPYTFVWSDGQSTSAAIGLCIGNYTVTVKDKNNCQNTLTVSIAPIVTLSVTVSGTSVSCPGSCDGIATATPFGGGNPYTYSWNPTAQTTQSATGFCAGTYTATVADVNGCISTNTVIFTNPPALTAPMSSTTASCGICNGTATVAPTGGTGAYNYTWSGFPVQTTATATGLCSGNYTVTVKDANNCSLTNTVTVGNIPTISSSPSITLATCGGSDGAICVGASGGTSPYTYLWSPGGATISCITGLIAGIYYVTVTDAAGCSNTFSNAVGNITGPTITLNSQINPTCNGSCDGSISVTASGANAPFTYSWNTTPVQTTSAIIGLCPGTYIVQATNSVTCSSFSSFTLTNPAQLSPNPTITNVKCNGGNTGSICLSPTGGNSPYTYKWLPAGPTTSCSTGLTAGTYSVVVADAFGCDDTIAVPIAEPSLLSVTIASTNVTCNGKCDGTATATVTGGTTLYTYAWSTGAPIPQVIGLCPNTYSILVTDANACTATASVVITQPAVLTATITSTNITCNSLCDGTATISASGGTIAYTYLWNTTPNQTIAAITGLCVGNYQSTVTDAKGCTTTNTVTVTQPSPISVSIALTNASCSGGCNGTATPTVSGGTPAYTYLWNGPSGFTATTFAVSGLCVGSYTLSVTDANVCPATILFSISAPAVLQANITFVQPSCFGGCNGIATSSPVGGIPPYTYLWCNGQTTNIATGLCAGTCTLTLSDANGCSVNQAVTITAPPPLAQANGVSGATCLLCNGSISLIASGGTTPYTFIWNTTPVQSTSTITGLCAGIYIDTVLDAKGCLTVDTISVSNTTGPVICVTGSNITCNGACDGTAIVSCATGDGPPWIYSWFPGNQTTQGITALCPNQYGATVIDTNGCKTVSLINITEPAALASNPLITNATCFGICNGSITLSPSGGTGAYTFTWAPGGQTTQNISSQCAGTYTVTIIDANNCSLTTTVTIGQNTIITATVTSTNSSCNSFCNGTAIITGSGGTLPYTYLWCNAQTSSAATGLCAGTCKTTITDAIGCIHIDSAVTTQPAVLASNITIVNPLCTSLCNGSLSAVPTGGTPPYTYLWSPGGATTTSITGLCAGNDTLIIIDANNCISTTTVTITDPLPISLTDVETNASCANVCDGAIDITPSGGTGAYTFTWSPGGQITEDITGLCAGIDTVIIKDVNGCSFTDSMTVGIVILVIADAGNDTSYCVPGTATLCSNSINATSIAWYDISAGWVFKGATNCISVSPAVGSTLYGLIAMNGICSDTDTVIVTVSAIPVVVPPLNDTICLGDSAVLCATGATIFQWYLLPNWTTPVFTGSCYTVSPTPGTTTFGIIGMNGVCSDSDSVSVTVLMMPIAITNNDTAFCAGGSITLCSNSLNAASLAWYDIPAWTLISDTDTCITVVPPSGINYFALIASNGICSDTDTVAVTVYVLPLVDAGTDITMLSGASTVLNGTGSGIYNWSPATGLSNTTVANPAANPTVTTTYTLTVTDTTGCVGWDTVRVTIVLDVVPNDGLSPNGDGINDLWMIPGIEAFPDAVVEVYNRWGELLFHSVGYATPWDAKFKNKELPVGTYYYVITLNNDLHKEPITGPITIMR